MTDQDIKIRLDDLLVLGLAFWPLFWSCWGLIRVPQTIYGLSVTSFVLYVIVALSVCLHPRIPLWPMLMWFVFLGVIYVENLRGRTAQCKRDLLVMLCAVLFCAVMQQQEFNKIMILRCLFWCGMIIALTVILDSLTHAFRIDLLGIYTPAAYRVKNNTQASAGLLAYTGTAGGIIYTGLGAWWALLRTRDGYVSRAVKWGVIACFAMAAVLILKRGFIVDFIVAAVFLILLHVTRDNLGRINMTRLIRGLFGLLIIVAAFMAAYLTLPAVRGPVDALVARFSGSDGTMATLSGRTDLYAVALRLFQQNKLTGVGWGKFRTYTVGFYNRSNDVSFAAHNVYLQVLCETGLFGFAAFIGAAGAALSWSVVRYRRLLKTAPDTADRYAAAVGISLQVFFLAYCMSGNPLYDYNFLITYFVGILLTSGSCPEAEKQDTGKENGIIENRHSYIL